MILYYIGFASGLLPCIAAVFNYKNLNSTLKTVALFFLLSFLIDFMMWLSYMKYINMKYNHPLLYLLILITLLFYTFFYYRSFYSLHTKKFTLYSGAVATIFFVIFVAINGIQKYPGWANTALPDYCFPVVFLPDI